ncbi:dihydrodipicolinate synthase family protein [uncultured Modestobacter sp.]|uniref:dihydrodipicolinate synthase family protein n=1 Tax=uncultured Modestobacter sp. TaxID=380048 RepID=UPI0026137D19|nr:dihydrodipicolinate synthase family protein [uncultured Modestobacter sp.]
MVGPGQLRGTYVALVTPFDERGAVAHEALEQLVSDCLDAGAAGVVALATTGEAAALDDAERDAVVATCSRVCVDRGAQLIVGAGTNDTRSTIARHEALADVRGVTASLAVVPYYVRPTEAAVVAHLQLVAQRAPVPVVVYNVPHRVGTGLGAAALLELAASDGIAGVKQAVNGIDADTLTVLARAPEDFAVLGGDDPYLFPMVLMGATGTISASANLVTSRFVAMIEDGLAGRLDSGRAHAEVLLPFALALFAEPSPAVIKALLHADGRIPTPDVRMPLSAASAPATRAALAARPG